MLTKGVIVQTAMDMLGMNGALSSATPDTNERFLRFLEMMVASWTNKGLSIGYKLDPDPMYIDASNDSGIVIDDLSAVAANLAVFGANALGTLAPPGVKSIAEDGYAALFAANPIPRQSNPYMPLGTGSAIWALSPTYESGEEALTVENNGNLDELTE
jgi:hypothetical protein